MSREPPLETEATELVAMEDAHEDDDDTSLPVSETTAGDLAGCDDVEQKESVVGASRFFMFRWFALAVLSGILSLPFLFSERRSELLPVAAAALATNSSRYIVFRSTLLAF